MDNPKNSPRLTRPPRFITCENAWMHGLTPALFRSMCNAGLPHWVDGENMVANVDDTRDWIRGRTPPKAPQV